MKYHDMIHAPEGKTLEFKQDLSSPQPVLKTLTDFVNSAVINALRLRFVVGLGTSVPVTLSDSKGQAQAGAQEPAQVEAQDQAQVDHQILTACVEKPLSSAEVAAALGHRQLSGNLRKALPRLRQAGLLAFTVPDHPKSRMQKYRLTDKGRQWIDEQKSLMTPRRGK
jgi:hypothetical protein